VNRRNHQLRGSQPRRILLAAAASLVAAVVAAGPALACAGLVTPSGNVKLTRTATLAAWHAGYEHYITAFTFTGGGAEVGSIVPLPGVPSKVPERGGDWTLQRLEREFQPQPVRASAPPEAAAGSADAEEVYNTRIDALDITILKGGGEAVARWAKEHGFSLTPDAPEVLDFYAARSPVFMAARFDATAARENGQEEGEGTPIHLTIPLDQPWVPLRILGLGRPAEETISADVYLLTPDRPNLLPRPNDGLVEVRSEWASQSLLDDLRSDKGMEWVPAKAWATYLAVGEEPSQLRYDLAIDAAGTGAPSPVMAGLEAPPAPATTTTTEAPTTTTAPSTTTSKPAPKPTPTTAAPSPPVTSAPAPVSGKPAMDHRAAGPVEPEVALPVVSAADGDGDGGAGPVAVAAAILGGGLGAAAVAGAFRFHRRRSTV
jgi:hypothetical protein